MEGGAFIITSWNHDRKVLCSKPDGGVYTTENKQGSWERWKICLHPNGHGVKIQSVEHGRCLAFSGEDIYTMDKEEDTAWNLVPAHGHQFFISATCHDKRLSSSNEHPFTHHNRKAWETWVVEPRYSEIGHFIIRSQEHGKYLGSSCDGVLFVRDYPHNWAIEIINGGIYIQSAEHGRKLSCNGDGHTYTVDANGGWELGVLSPFYLVHSVARICGPG